MGEAGIGDQTLVRQDKKRKKEDVDSSEDSPGKPSARRRGGQAWKTNESGMETQERKEEGDP